MTRMARCMLGLAVLCCGLPLMSVVFPSTADAQVQLSTGAGRRSAQQQGPALPSLSPQAQLALDELSPRFATEIEQIQGWFRDRPVLYFNFGFVNEPVRAGRVIWPILSVGRVMAKGN